VRSSGSVSGDIRRRVAQRAEWRCEYCLLSEDDSGFRHQIDHIVSKKHGGDSSEDNLAFACAVCNRNKGSDVAALGLGGRPVSLFHPRRQAWRDHFRLDGPIVRPLTATGEVTIRVLRLNDPWRVEERVARLGGG
jgi:hypothetical protein